MFGRPRCREWTPLATQQLRLRSLLQIVGYNIRPPETCSSHCSFYLTLHHTTMSAPFYTSERISSPHPKWKEIDSEVTQRMSSTNIVIRIWCHTLINAEECEKPQDTIIQTWGVYFSGLRYIGANLALNFTSDCFKSNTLVFQMHGGYFCSYKSLKLDIIPPENEIEHGSLSSDSSGKTNHSKVTLEAKFIQHQKVKEARSISPNKLSRKLDKEYSKSHSPVERNFRHFPNMKTSISLNINERHRRDAEEKKTDPNYIYEHSPDSMDVIASDGSEGVSKNGSREDLTNSKIDLSETAENYDLRNESDGTPKYRYLALNFLKSEIRHSYNASKLQKLHLLQYSIKKRQEAVQEIKERIYQKSALSIDCSNDFDATLKFKSKSQRNLFSPEENIKPEQGSMQSDLKNGKVKVDRPVTSNGPRLTLKLNDLLSFKSKPSPFQRAEHVRLTKQLEILRFKRIILADERDSKLANIRRLKETHAKLVEENQDVGLELLQDYHTLSRRAEILKETRVSCAALRALAARSHAALLAHRTSLLQHLHQVFYIQQKDETTWTICDVPLPICGDDSPRNQGGVSDAVAAGFAAQATCLAAAITNQPLRYKITLLGSATKILDLTPDLPDPNIPLFARGGDVALFRYAMFLLNKCIAQLLWGLGMPVADMRPTLANLQRLLTAPCNLTDTSKLFGTYRWVSDNQCPRTQSLRSLVASERGKHNRQFNRFKELPALDASTTSIMGSEPNIYDTKLAQHNPEITSTMKTHNSDSEISRISAEHRLEFENKVIFTLGNDTRTALENIEKEQLVRISSNNGDQVTPGEIDDNVKRICTEITDFCTKDIHEGFDIAQHIDNIDIAKHMEQRVTEIEDVDICESCESNKDGVCDLACAKNVKDVIVIPSAEAILDTGQSDVIDLGQELSEAGQSGEERDQ